MQTSTYHCRVCIILIKIRKSEIFKWLKEFGAILVITSLSLAGRGKRSLSSDLIPRSVQSHQEKHRLVLPSWHALIAR